MNLLILPGAGNPDSPLYAKVYSLISCEAKKYGYRSVFTDLRWPGHTTDHEYFSSKSISLPRSVQAARRRIDKLPKGAFTILGRFFGSIVALKLAKTLTTTDRVPSRLILWGPPPYWLLWEMFVRDFLKNKAIAKSKGLKVDRDYHTSIEPVESMLKEVHLPTVVAAGTADQYCTPAFLDYLRALTAQNQFVKIRTSVPGATHEVTSDNYENILKVYSQTLFDV